MSLQRARFSPPDWGFPRVSGDEPDNMFDIADLQAFSPRERG